MTEPLEVWFQHGEDLVLDVQPNPFEFFGDEFSGCWPRWGKRYVDGDVGIELRARVSPGSADKNACDISLVIERAGPHLGLGCDEFTVLRVGQERDFLPHFSGAGEYKVPVLIYVAELVQNPKRVLARLIPSVVRLQSLDDSLDLDGHLATGLHSAIHVGADSGVNREHTSPLFDPVPDVRDTKRVGEMIKSGAHIVNRVSDDERQRLGEVASFFKVHNDEFSIPRTLVLLSDLVIRVRLEEFFDGRLDRYQVLPCTL